MILIWLTDKSILKLLSAWTEIVEVVSNYVQLFFLNVLSPSHAQVLKKNVYFYRDSISGGEKNQRKNCAQPSRTHYNRLSSRRHIPI